MKHVILILLIAFFSNATIADVIESNTVMRFSTEAGNISVAVVKVEDLTIMTVVSAKLKGRTTIANGTCDRLWFHAKAEALYCNTRTRQYELKLY